MFVICYGSPFEGLSLVGLFVNTEEAIQYAETCRNIRNETWHIVKLERVES